LACVLLVMWWVGSGCGQDRNVTRRERVQCFLWRTTNARGPTRPGYDSATPPAGRPSGHLTMTDRTRTQRSVQLMK